MGYLVKGFLEIHYYDIHLLFFINCLRNILYGWKQLSFARMAFAKTMLLTTEYTVCVQVGHNIGVQYVFNNFAAYSS